MVAPKTTTWPLEPHSRAKHEILRRYLQAWTTILGAAGSPRILYIDGFAGPGRYAGGEDGSPIIALKAALQHKDRLKGAVHFLFIEEGDDRAAMLDQIVCELVLPATFKVKVEAGTFEAGTAELLQTCRATKTPLPPTFAFIDPFGWTGVPFDVVREILSHPKCEVLVNFMYEEIHRFLGHPDQGNNLDRLFGTHRWRQIVPLSGRQRRQAIHDLYLAQLRSAARFVRSFEMRNDKDVTDYFLFFATGSRTGLRKMKEAMWKVDPGGEFRFSDATDPRQVLLFQKEPDRRALRTLIVGKFAGIEAAVGTIENFVVDETPFRETHYKSVLREMELARPPALVPVDPPSNRKIGTFPDPKLRVRFS